MRRQPGCRPTKTARSSIGPSPHPPVQIDQDVATLASSVRGAYRLPMIAPPGSPWLQGARPVYNVLGSCDKVLCISCRSTDQLVSVSISLTWWRWADSNPRPPACKAGALPLSYIPEFQDPGRAFSIPGERIEGSCATRACTWRVGQPGIEPGTSVLSGLRSNRLSYWPGEGRAEKAR